MNGLNSALAAFIAFAVTGISGIWLVPFLRRLKFGQNIKAIGPIWHKAKQGTPIMGGLMFAGGITISIFLLYYVFPYMFGLKSALGATEKATLAGGIFMALIFGFIGFMDDYIKVVKKRNLGLTAKQKLMLQILAAVVFLLVKFMSGDTRTSMLVPFTNYTWNMGIYLYVPISIFIIVSVVNAVNLTDGVDGLCGSVTFVAAIALMLVSRMVGLYGYTALSAAIAGGCLGFLIWNFHPAKVFMGDTGSLFLGGILCALSFGINQPLLIVPIGIIYVVETLSVIIQVFSFKTTGKRVFKMSPIHHHFEMSGWTENKIVVVFSLITAVCSGLAVFWFATYMGVS